MYVLVRLAVGPLVNGARTRPLCKMMGPSEAGCIAQMGPMTVASSLVSRSSLSATELVLEGFWDICYHQGECALQL